MGAAPQPSTFAIATKTSNSGIAVRMALARGSVTQAEITPPLVDMGDRVPITAANKRGVIDPASALVMPVQGRGDLMDPANCNRTLPIFDGATRFDVTLSYGETRSVAKPGYSGPVLVCNARYLPIAGHRPDRPGVKFMEDNREMSVWLAPVEGTRGAAPRADRRAYDGRHQHHRGDALDAHRGTRERHGLGSRGHRDPRQPRAVRRGFPPRGAAPPARRATLASAPSRRNPCSRRSPIAAAAPIPRAGSSRTVPRDTAP